MPFTSAITACPRCMFIQRLPEDVSACRCCCAQCGKTLSLEHDAAHSNVRACALALAALILFPLAITLPMLTVRQMGHAHSSSVLEGVVSLLSKGDIIVGVIVLMCSIVLPVGKLVGIMTISLAGERLASRHRSLTHRLLEFTGRWGMLDVLAVAVLVAALKLGDIMEVQSGPAAIAFTLCVVLSLLATAVFDPRAVWPRSNVRAQDHSAAQLEFRGGVRNG